MSQFVVSARKYRPLRFEDVVGQEHVTTTLKNALNTDKVAHAFLFCGPRGVGKTSCARILAKAINCMNPSPDREPCNACTSCVSFNENASFNIIELDAASNNKVEHIRLLNEQVRFQPQQGKYKVFIIDEVHMLTTQAFNAFLKTLEEPPPYAIFILATTEKHKILPTILSRCQIFDFHRIQVSDIARHLQIIAQKENLTTDEEALRLIATKADGALRDALSLFDRIATTSSQGITYENVIQQLNILDYDYYFQFVEAFLSEDDTRVMSLFDEVLSNGFDGDLFLSGLSDHLRQLLVAKHPDTHRLIEGGENLKKRYIEQSAKTSKGFLLTALSLLNEGDIHYARARHKRLHVEICLARITFMNRVVRPDQGTAASVSVEKKKIDDRTPGPSATSVTAIRPSNEDKSAQGRTDVQSKSPQDAPPHIPLNIPSIQSTSVLTREIKEEWGEKSQNADTLDLHQLQIEWKKYIKNLKGTSIKKLFDSSQIEWEGEVIHVRVVTQIARDTLSQDDSFVQHLRETYRRPELKMNIQIDEERAEALRKENVKPLSAREKFDQLAQANPLFLQLQREFDLKPDGEV